MATPTKLRSLYRSLLRELPPRALTRTSRTPLQTRIRESIASSPTTAATPIEHADQFVQYLRAQRAYASLLERYNPGMNMEEEDRIRMTARRVGMDLPDEFSYANLPEGEGEGRGKDGSGDGSGDGK